MALFSPLSEYDSVVSLRNTLVEQMTSNKIRFPLNQVDLSLHFMMLIAALSVAGD